MEFNQVNIQDLQLEHSIEVDPSSGCAAALVNIPLPDGRDGFGPQLALVYSSSSRNSIFGIGWNISGLSYICIDTKKGVPKYNGLDKYAFNGSSQLVPQLIKAGSSWVQRIEETAQFWIYYYRVKIEDSFTRFEKWISKTTGAIHWRTRSKSNVVSVYGLASSGATRIADPKDPNKIFIWLLQAQYDNLGNCVQFEYKTENEDNLNPALSFETGRLKQFRQIGFAQKYPDRILFGNSLPLLPDDPIPAANKWCFEIAFDYGQYTARPYTASQPLPGAAWTVRADPFSIYQSGFEVRTYRLCKRLLVYHHFAELGTPTSLTGIFECHYNPTESGTTLQGITYTGIRRDLITGTYSEKSLPALSFTYTNPSVGETFKGLAHETNENVPQGFIYGTTRLIDLLGEGIPGILNETASTWYYKPNLGNGVFGKQELVIQKPAQNLGVYSLGDFDQDGNLNLFSLQGRMAGYYEYDSRRENWSGFTPFNSIPQVGQTKLLDINNDGFPDLILERTDSIVCYEFKGKKGFDQPYEFAKPKSNGKLYAPTIGDNTALGYFLADMTGDGLADQVQISNGHVEYYPNLGNGHFGESVLMENPPIFDYENAFDANRIRLYDLDGSGTTDILYLGNGRLQYWLNCSGNRFMDGVSITGLPWIDNLNSAMILDLLGDGTPCLVWSNSLWSFQGNSLQYLELTNGIKPRLMISMENGLGKEVQIEYGYSGQHYLDAKKMGRPWISKLPLHFTVVNQKKVIDHISNTLLTTQYKYSNGQYNGNERSFVTFGLVEQYDTQLYINAASPDDKNYAQPSCCKTWYHGGISGEEGKRASEFYIKDANQSHLPVYFFEQTDALIAEDFELALQSLAGKIIHQEVYAANSEGVAAEHPYLVSEMSYGIRQLQPKTKLDDSSFFAYQTENLSITYEQNPADPRISHHLIVSVNAFGDIEKELSISYARRSSAPNPHPRQRLDYCTAAINRYVNTDSLAVYLPGTLYESKDFELNGISHSPDELIKLVDMQTAFDGWISAALSFDQTLPAAGTTSARLISWDRNYFWNDAFTAALALGQTGTRVFSHHEESACFNDTLITQIFAGKVTPQMLSNTDEGHYHYADGYWWQQTTINHFNNANSFYCLHHIERGGETLSSYQYDPYYLTVLAITDGLGNVKQGLIDYNLLEPYQMIDENDNIAEVLYDALGVAIVSTHQGTLLDRSNTLQKYGFERIADYTRRTDESFGNILANPAIYIQQASTFLFYDFDIWKTGSKPVRSIQLTRENLRHDGAGTIDAVPRLIIEVDYQDGFGRAIQNKRKVEPGPAIQRNADGTIELDAENVPVLSHSNNRWLVSGHTVYNNKQQLVRQFEPFFSVGYEYENDLELETYGVSAQNYYDAVGRTIRTDFPDNTFTESSFTPWEVQTSDQNDTVDRSLYKLSRQVLPAGDPERMALERSLTHKDTPSIVKLDALGREIVHLEMNNDGTNRQIEYKQDITSNIAEIIDPRNLKSIEYKRDMLGRILSEKSVDAGTKWSFHSNADQTIHLWDSRGIHQRTFYDLLDRVTSVHVDGGLGLNQTIERFVYGEDAIVLQAKEKNLRGQLVKHYDHAGTQEIKSSFPGGKAVQVERKLLDQFLTEPNWNFPEAVSLEPDSYLSEYIYDALDRPVLIKLPDKTTRKFVFNEGGGIGKVLISTQDGQFNEVELLKNTSYDAKGLRQTALLGNDVELTYSYDPNTYRLVRLQSRKINATPRTYQDIHYTFDPVGNLIYIVDAAQEPAAPNPLVIQGLNVSTHSDFEYDALYQLKIARGRVHQALLKNDYADRSRESGVPDDWVKGTRHITLNNGGAVERYTRSYDYDLSGNIVRIRHQGATQNWTEEIWTSATSNRSLPLNDLNGIPVTNPESRFDASGDSLYLPHLQSIEWNYRNNISRAIVIDRSAQGKPNDEEYYVYAGDGMRIRKITQRVVNVASSTIEQTEKIYLDGCEIKRIIRDGNEILKRFTSQITDGVNDIALIHAWEKDTLGRETDSIAVKKIHYQLGNHLGSLSFELDQNGDVISYEEYFPYGGTSFIAGRSKREIELKEYRYSGKEKDDYTGLYYFGYRYYAHWLGSWISPDPIGPEDSINLYLYVHNNPINVVDANGLNGRRTVSRHGTPRNQTIEQARRWWEGRIIVRDRQRYRVHVRSITPGTGGAKWDIEADLTPVDRRGQPLPSPSTPPPNQETQEPGDESLDPNAGGTGGRSEGGGTQGSGGGTGQTGSETSGTGTSQTGGNTTGAGGGSPDSSGTGRLNDTSNGGNNNSMGNGGPQVETNGGGGGGNTGDGGTASGIRGAGQQGRGTGGGGTTPQGTGQGITPGTGNGAGTRPGTGTGAGAGNRPGNGPGGTGRTGEGSTLGGGPYGREDGQIGGSEQGSPGGQLGGDPEGTVGGDLSGSLEGRLDGSPDGRQGGTDEERREGTVEGQRNQTGQDNPSHPSQQEGNRQGPATPNRQGATQGQGRGQQADPNRNWLDTVTHYAGYLNLEFGGGGQNGQAGGIPGGMDLFGWRPPMWVRRTLQVLYIATTVVLLIIPIGKLASAAKVAIQGVLRAGLRASVRRLLAAIATRLPTRAAIRNALTRARAAFSNWWHFRGNGGVTTIVGSRGPYPGRIGAFLDRIGIRQGYRSTIQNLDIGGKWYARINTAAHERVHWLVDRYLPTFKNLSGTNRLGAIARYPEEVLAYTVGHIASLRPHLVVMAPFHAFRSLAMVYSTRWVMAAKIFWGSVFVGGAGYGTYRATR